MLTRLLPLVRAGLGRRLALATLSSGAVWAAGTLATFAVGVLLARWLGPAGYGTYGTVIAVVTLLGVPAQLGLPLLATREVSAARTHGRDADIAAIGWWFAAVVATASTLLAVSLYIAAGTLPLAPTLATGLLAAAWLLPPLSLSTMASGLLRGQERIVASQALDVLVRPLLFVAALLAWSQPLQASGAIRAQSVAAAGIALVGFALFFRRLPKSGTRGTRRLRAWTAAALPMTLLEAMRALEGSYGVLVASYALGTAEAGLLRVAMASAMIVTVPISLQNIVVAPFLAGAHAAGEMQRLARIVAGSTLFMTVSVTAITLAFAAAGQWALPFAFGEAFAGAYWPLLVLCLGQLLTAALGPATMLLSMSGHERVVARAFVVSVPAAVAAAVVLTPLMGVLGTAVSTIVAAAIRGILLNREAKRKLGFSPSLLGTAKAMGSHSSPAS